MTEGSLSDPDINCPVWVDSGRFSGALVAGIRVMRASMLITSVGRHFLCYR